MPFFYYKCVRCIGKRDKRKLCTKTGKAYMELAPRWNDRWTIISGLEKAVYRLSHGNDECTDIEQPDYAPRGTILFSILCLKLWYSCSRCGEATRGMPNQDDILAFLDNELLQQIVNDLDVVGWLWIPSGRGSSVKIGARNISDVQFCQIRCWKLRAVCLDSSIFQSGEERLVGLRCMVRPMTDHYREIRRHWSIRLVKFLNVKYSNHKAFC